MCILPENNLFINGGNSDYPSDCLFILVNGAQLIPLKIIHKTWKIESKYYVRSICVYNSGNVYLFFDKDEIPFMWNFLLSKTPTKKEARLWRYNLETRKMTQLASPPLCPLRTAIEFRGCLIYQSEQHLFLYDPFTNSHNHLEFVKIGRDMLVSLDNTKVILFKIDDRIYAINFNHKIYRSETNNPYVWTFYANEDSKSDKIFMCQNTAVSENCLFLCSEYEFWKIDIHENYARDIFYVNKKVVWNGQIFNFPYTIDFKKPNK